MGAQVILIQNLVLTATEDEINAGNATITFFVGGVQAFQTVPFQERNPRN